MSARWRERSPRRRRSGCCGAATGRTRRRKRRPMTPCCSISSRTGPPTRQHATASWFAIPSFYTAFHNRPDHPRSTAMSIKSDPLSDIQRDFARVSPEIVKKAAGFQAAILADVAGRRGTLNGRIRGLAPTMKFAGPALTVEVRPGDNLMIHAAMALARPGDVLVVDGKGDQTCALMGAIMMNACKKIGLAGVILDAACRDAEEICQLDFPVFSVGTNPNG